MKKIISFLLVVVLFVLLMGCSSENKAQKRPSVINSICAKFEYADEKDGGYKVIASEILTLSNFFESVILVESDEDFSGEWIYRITFNWNGLYIGADEIIVLVGKDSMSIDGTNYIAGEGVDFSILLDLVSAKYEFFDYELDYD